MERDGKKRNTLFLGIYDGLGFVFSNKYRFLSFICECPIKVPCVIDKGTESLRRELRMHSQSGTELGLRAKVITPKLVQFPYILWPAAFGIFDGPAASGIFVQLY